MAQEDTSPRQMVLGPGHLQELEPELELQPGSGSCFESRSWSWAGGALDLAMKAWTCFPGLIASTRVLTALALLA
jgi:hypothetical protein